MNEYSNASSFGEAFKNNDICADQHSTHMNRVYLLTGGNMGDRVANLYKAMALIGRDCGRVKKVSACYETAAWGKTNQPNFINQAISLLTTLEPNQLLKKILGIELELGRIREEKYGPRIIDIDILLFDQLIIDQPDLKIPHPELPNRRFALVPLAEIAGDVIHPIKKNSIRQLLIDCPDKLEVKKYYAN